MVVLITVIIRKFIEYEYIILKWVFQLKTDYRAINARARNEILAVFVVQPSFRSKQIHEHYT